MRLVLVLVTLAALGAGCDRTRTPPTCAEVGAHVVKLFAPADDYARDVGAAFSERCQADGWSGEVRACIGGTRALVEPKHCRQALTEAQRTQLDAALAAAEQRERARVIPAACRRYEQLLAKVMTCDRLPLDARTALQHKLDAAKRDWPSLPDKRALEPICGSAIQAVKAAAVECPGASTW